MIVRTHQRRLQTDGFAPRFLRRYGIRWLHVTKSPAELVPSMGIIGRQTGGLSKFVHGTGVVKSIPVNVSESHMCFGQLRVDGDGPPSKLLGVL